MSRVVNDFWRNERKFTTNESKKVIYLILLSHTIHSSRRNSSKNYSPNQRMSNMKYLSLPFLHSLGSGYQVLGGFRILPQGQNKEGIFLRLYSMRRLFKISSKAIIPKWRIKMPIWWVLFEEQEMEKINGIDVVFFYSLFCSKQAFKN